VHAAARTGVAAAFQRVLRRKRETRESMSITRSQGSERKKRMDERCSAVAKPRQGGAHGAAVVRQEDDGVRLAQAQRVGTSGTGRSARAR
jgi:hypothetical protein